MAKLKCWVGFVLPEKGKSWTYDAIMWAFKDHAVHIFLMFGTDLETSTVYQTTPTITSKGSFAGRLKLAPIECHLVKDIDAEKAKEWCEANLNNRYDYIGIVGLTIILVFEKLLNKVLSPVRNKWISLNFPNFIHSKKKFYCSEYVIGGLKAGECSKVYETGNSMAPEQRRYCYDNKDVYRMVFNNVVKPFECPTFWEALKGVVGAMWDLVVSKIK